MGIPGPALVQRVLLPPASPPPGPFSPWTWRPQPRGLPGRPPFPSPPAPAPQPGSEIMQIPGGSLIKSLTRRWGRARGGAESRGHAPEGPARLRREAPAPLPGLGTAEPPAGADRPALPPRPAGPVPPPPRPPLPAGRGLPSGAGTGPGRRFSRGTPRARGRGRTCARSCGPRVPGPPGSGAGRPGQRPPRPFSDACCWANSRGRGRLKGRD